MVEGRSKMSQGRARARLVAQTRERRRARRRRPRRPPRTWRPRRPGRRSGSRRPPRPAWPPGWRPPVRPRRRRRAPRGRARRRRPGASPSGWPRSCPCSDGAVPCGASAMATTGRRSSSRARSTDSAPAMDPNRASTRSERQSPSRLSAGTTRGWRSDSVIKPGVGGVDQRGPVGDVGVPRGRGVHLLLQHPLVDGRDGPLRPAVDAGAQLRRPCGTSTRPRTGRPSGRSARSATPALRPVPASPVRSLLGPVGVARRPCARPRSGGRRAPAGATPGMRRPVRTMTEPPMPSRRMRLGLPTSPVVSGVMVAAFSPRPVSPHGGCGVADHPVGGGPPVLERQVEVHQLEIEPEDAGVEHPQRLVEELLAGLVAVADDESLHGRHAARVARNRRSPPPPPSTRHLGTAACAGRPDAKTWKQIGEQKNRAGGIR